jgi:hypothetical protein
MTTLRPDCGNASASTPVPARRLLLNRIYYAVKKRRSLAYGKLHDGDKCCAMGAYFDDYGGAVDAKMIDEVAAVNDSVPPTALPSERRRHMLRWLEWELGL